MTTSPRDQTSARGFDPWALAAAASALLPLLKAWGAPLGEPVADDYDFLRRSLLEPGRSLLDSGGAVIYWRPLARQIYYALAGPLMLSSPLALALLHAALLGLAAFLIQRALCPAWGGPRAAVAATFPVIADSARTLILWPAAFQDLWALLFCALALHEASRRRLPTTLAALLAALLCKEVAVVAALLIPWMPESAGAPKRARGRWIAAVGALTAAWGLAYAGVMRSAHVMFQGQLEAARPPFVSRWIWALGSSLQDAFSLRALPPILIAIGVIVVAALVALQRGGAGPGARAAGAKSLAWMAWGALWFALCSVTLAETFPVWGSFRSTVGLVGFGIVCVAALPSARPIGLALLAGARVALLLLAPGASPAVTEDVPGDGAGFDFATLTRLQRFSRETREALRAGAPALGNGARVAWLHRPLMTERAFAHSRALQVWYRDTTLQWVQWKEAVAAPGRAIGAGLEFEPAGARGIVLVSPAALEEIPRAVQAMKASEYRAALSILARADSLQPDRGAAVFLGTVAGKRALCFLGLDDGAAARREADRSLALWRDGADARYVLAVEFAAEGRRMEGIAQLDTVLSLYPFDQAARILRDELRQAGP